MHSIYCRCRTFANPRFTLKMRSDATNTLRCYPVLAAVDAALVDSAYGRAEPLTEVHHNIKMIRY